MELRERIAVILFKDDVIHGHLQYWELPIADWDKASTNLKQAYYILADEILNEITKDETKLMICNKASICEIDCTDKYPHEEELACNIECDWGGVSV